MTSVYTVPMRKSILALFFIFIMAVAGAVSWSFKAGFMWTGICLIAVAAPLGILYWYMLYVNPSQARITLTDEGLHVYAPPFVDDAIGWSSVSKATSGTLHETPYKLGEVKRMMRFGGYESGTAALEDGSDAIIIARNRDIACVFAEGKWYLIAPAGGAQTLVDEINEHIG